MWHELRGTPDRAPRPVTHPDLHLHPMPVPFQPRIPPPHRLQPRQQFRRFVGPGDVVVPALPELPHAGRNVRRLRGHKRFAV
jgi:hypothetical protein